MYDVRPKVTNRIRKNGYVDNLLGTASTMTELKKLRASSKSVLNRREWATNNPELKKITDEARDTDSTSTDHVLGVRWDTINCSLTVAPSDLKTGQPTKRIILRS